MAFKMVIPMSEEDEYYKGQNWRMEKSSIIFDNAKNERSTLLCLVPTK